MSNQKRENAMDEQNLDFGFPVEQEGPDKSSPGSKLSPTKWIVSGIVCIGLLAFLAYRVLGSNQSSDDAVVQLARTINESNQQLKALENRVDEQEHAVQTQQTNQGNVITKLQHIERDVTKLDRVIMSRLDNISTTLESFTSSPHPTSETPREGEEE